MQKILLPIDGSDSCNKAILKASEFAKMANAEVTILNVLEELNIQMGNKEDIDRKFEYHECLKDESSKVIEKCFNNFKDVPKKLKTMQKKGIPSVIICEVAEEGDFDLVVIADMGKTSFEKFLLGSTTEKVVRHCKTSVLVVK